MKKRKVKKTVWVILAAAIVFIAVVGTLFFRKPEDNTVAENTTPEPEATAVVENHTPEPEESTAPEETVIIENQGDIELIIPEDMESDGF